MAYRRRWKRRPTYPPYPGTYPTTGEPAGAPSGPPPVPPASLPNNGEPMPSDKLASDFPTWGAFVNYVEREQGTSKLHVSQDNESGYGDNWAGTKTWADALGFARNGDPSGCDRIQHMLAPIISKLTSLVEKPVMYMDVYSPFGLYDMGAVVQMLPEPAYNYTTRYEDEKGVRVCKIVVNVSSSAIVDTEALAVRGALIAGVVNALELSGVRAEVVMGFACSTWDTYKHTHLYVTLKQASEDLDLPLLAYQLCSSSVLRRLIFKFMEIHGVISDSYGSPRDIPQDKQGDLYFCASHAARVDWKRYAEPDAAIVYIREQLKAQNVTLAE